MNIKRSRNKYGKIIELTLSNDSSPLGAFRCRVIKFKNSITGRKAGQKAIFTSVTLGLKTPG